MGRSGPGHPGLSTSSAALGGILCLAAILKAASSFGSLDEGFETIVVLAGSCVEAVIGVALVLSHRRSIFLPAAGLLFVLFAGIAWIGTVRGASSCGCFGSVPVPPSALLVFDVGMAFALLWGPRTSGSMKQNQAVALDAACIGIFFVGSAVGSILYPRLGTVTSVLSHEAIAAAKTVIIERGSLRPGRHFPLLPFLHINADLATGHWKVILARAGCRKCEKGLRRR